MNAEYKLSGHHPVVVVTDGEDVVKFGCGYSNEKHYTHRPVIAQKVVDAINNYAALIERERILREALELGLFILTIPAVQDVNKAINNERPSQNPIADFGKKAREAIKAVSK